MSEKHHGWTNYPTWAMELWLYEEPQYREITENTTNSQELAARIKNLVEENIPSDLEGMYADLLNWAITQVNWQELAAWKDEEN